MKLFDKTIKSSELSGSNSFPNSSKDFAKLNTIYRLGHSDDFAYKNCKIRDDRFFMDAHSCRASSK